MQNKTIELKAVEDLNDIIKLSDIKADSAPQTIKVFPRARVFIQKYNDYFDFNQEFFNEIAKSFDNDTVIRPFIDNDHKMADSYGDVLGYKILDDGMYFDIKLNDNGIDAIQTGKYKYISPAFSSLKDTNGVYHKWVLLAISLTNFPALMRELPALQEQLTLSGHIGGNNMDLRNKLCNFFQLQGEASDAAIIDAIQSFMSDLDKIKADLQAAIEGKAAAEEKAKVSEEKAEVAEKAAEEMNAELTLLKTEKLQDEAAKVIDDAVEAGQYHPSIRELKYKKYLDGGKEEIEKELSLIPKIELSGEINKTVKKLDNSKISDNDKAIMLDCGLNPEKEEDIKFFINANKGVE